MFETLFVSKQRVSPFYHDLDLCLVGLVENFLLVEQLLLLVVEERLLLVVEQLQNPNHTSNYLCRKSWEVVEVSRKTFWYMISSDFIRTTFEIQ